MHFIWEKADVENAHEFFVACPGETCAYRVVTGLYYEQFTVIGEIVYGAFCLKTGTDMTELAGYLNEIAAVPVEYLSRHHDGTYYIR